ncbi:MAG: InlB B-repeat-containing protein [Saccharofermentans sp.]|nr:InlB B-repeat-containing protein [Saccharofermentans sp.]
MIRKIAVSFMALVLSVGMMPLCSLADETVVDNKAEAAYSTSKIDMIDRDYEVVKVRLAPNGGKGKSITFEVDMVEEVVPFYLEACPFTRGGYTFTGWNTKANGKGISYKTGEEVPITKDTTLYAQWKKNCNYKIKIRAPKKISVKKPEFTVKATVKSGNKAVKRKKVILIFGGFKYSAKTNSKGVAKLKVKKAAYNKRMTGKKYTYYVICGNKYRKAIMVVK